MEIAENNAERITLVENESVAFFLGFAVFGAFFLVCGLLMLFGQVSEIVAPGWAESHGFSGFRWHSEGSNVPSSLAVSVALSLFCVALSLSFLWLGGTRLLFSIRRHLVFDFNNGQVILKRRGLFRSPDRTVPISGTFARIEEEDDGGYKRQFLHVTAVPNEDQLGQTLWLEKVDPDQVKTLGRLF